MTKRTEQQPTLTGKDVLRSIVGVETSVPPDGFTASILGTERSGSGVVIGEKGLVLTIGYLITEAEQVSLTTASGRVVEGHPLAYDQETGFGLIQALGPLDAPAIAFGDSAEVRTGDDVFFASAGEVVEAQLAAKQEFAGYWEYLLDEALFTAPAHPSWGGGALIGADGRLLGVGSLMLQAATQEGTQDINMVVPINLLPPILDELVTRGRVDRPARPWLGLYSTDNDGHVVAMNVDPRGPAAAAGMQAGDIIRDVRDRSIDDLGDFYRAVWASGPAGTEIPLRIVRDGREQWIRIKSADRDDFLKKPVLQ